MRRPLSLSYKEYSGENAYLFNLYQDPPVKSRFHLQGLIYQTLFLIKVCGFLLLGNSRTVDRLPV